MSRWKKIKDKDTREKIYKYFTDNDFVQVVRCKDCKHSYIDIEGNRICKTDEYIGTMVMDNDYCSYGERREDNASG